jgi:hypothetical protein
MGGFLCAENLTSGGESQKRAKSFRRSAKSLKSGTVGWALPTPAFSLDKSREFARE